MTNAQIKAAALRVSVLEEELGTCTTEAMAQCVKESLDAARARLRVLKAEASRIYEADR